MKTPNTDALNALKAPVNDPIITGTASHTSTTGNAGKDGSGKFTIRLDKNLLGRIRAAYLADLATGHGIGSLSAWAATHLEKAVQETEDRLHGGKPFDPIGVGSVPRLPLMSSK